MGDRRAPTMLTVEVSQAGGSRERVRYIAVVEQRVEHQKSRCVVGWWKDQEGERVQVQVQLKRG